MTVSEERGRGFEELLLQLESNDSQNNNNRTKQRYLKLNLSSKGYNLWEFKSGLPLLNLLYKVCSQISPRVEF